ncbi:MAG: DNA-processing protein DprA [Patescibacteria group bacterium]
MPTQTISLRDQRYPALLKEIHDPPARIFVRGELPPPDALCVSVVGTRRMSAYGARVVQLLVPPLARAGAIIVSGLAFGVDAAAHEAALAAGGRTVAVLPGGIDDMSIVPRHHLGLAQNIASNRGALLSEHPDKTQTHAGSFPVRNRIIAGLSRATLIVEATSKSGTTLTARLAMDENRLVLAVPGPIDQLGSEGPHRLIKDGAIPITSVDDLFQALDLKQLTLDLPAESPEQAAILSTLKREPLSVDALVALTSLPTANVLATLTELELQGRVITEDRQTYSLSSV